MIILVSWWQHKRNTINKLIEYIWLIVKTILCCGVKYEFHSIKNNFRMGWNKKTNKQKCRRNWSIIRLRIEIETKLNSFHRHQILGNQHSFVHFALSRLHSRYICSNGISNWCLGNTFTSCSDKENQINDP